MKTKVLPIILIVMFSLLFTVTLMIIVCLPALEYTTDNTVILSVTIVRIVKVKNHNDISYIVYTEEYEDKLQIENAEAISNYAYFNTLKKGQTIEVAIPDFWFEVIDKADAVLIVSLKADGNNVITLESSNLQERKTKGGINATGFVVMSISIFIIVRCIMQIKRGAREHIA